MTDDGPPGCPAADPDTRTPAISVPARAWDCHAHVFGPSDVYPYDPGRSYTPPDAPYAAYRKMLDVLGVERACLVQPSVHGTDNTAMLDAIKEAGGAFRGIAVVETGVTDAELRRLHDGGVRGLRLNLQHGGRDALEGIGRTAERIAPMGWHLQFLADIADFADVLADLHRLPVDVLFDHLGHMPTTHGLDAQPFQDLLAMMGDGRCWVKLSGPYRTTREQGVPFSDTLPFVRALVGAAPERIVWGTDWPHPHMDIPMVNDGDLMDLLAEWIPDNDARNRVLVENPARLFGFAD